MGSFALASIEQLPVSLVAVGRGLTCKALAKR
jgi:hypothetical protein